MSNEELLKLVRTLRTELHSSGATDAVARAHIESLAADLEQKIASGEARESLVDRVKQSVERFEVEHPGITGILNEILITLGNIGV